MNIQQIKNSFKMVQETDSKNKLFIFAEDTGSEEQVILEIISYIGDSSYRKMLRNNDILDMRPREFTEYMDDSNSWNDNLAMFTKWLSGDEAQDIFDIFNN